MEIKIETVKIAYKNHWEGKYLLSIRFNDMTEEYIFFKFDNCNINKYVIYNTLLPIINKKFNSNSKILIYRIVNCVCAYPCNATQLYVVVK